LYAHLEDKSLLDFKNLLPKEEEKCDKVIKFWTWKKR